MVEQRTCIHCHHDKPAAAFNGAGTVCRVCLALPTPRTVAQRSDTRRRFITVYNQLGIRALLATTKRAG